MGPPLTDDQTNDSIAEATDSWKERLTSEQYHVTREQGTEPPFSGAYLNLKEPGTYHCVCCGALLFTSQHKYDSGSGWPSFWDVATPEALGATTDSRYGMTRVEIHCDDCDAHLGHQFDDGPAPTGQRYCINSVALSFQPQQDT